MLNNDIFNQSLYTKRTRPFPTVDNLKELSSFYASRMKVLLHSQGDRIPWCCEMNVVGDSVSLLYVNGRLTQAVSEDNLLKGSSIAYITNHIPVTLAGANIPEYVEVFGQVVPETDNVSHPLSFIATGIGNISKDVILPTQYEIYKQLQQWGYMIYPYIKRCFSLHAIQQCYRYVLTKRDGLDRNVNGLTIRLDNIRQQRCLGSSNQSPYWGVAYLFPIA